MQFKPPKYLPTLTISSIEEAEIVNKILESADIPYLEVTLRSSVSIEAIEYIADQTNINLGIGTVLNTNQLLNLPIPKIKFVVSPGFNKDVAYFCKENNIEYIPGVETSTEIMEAQSYGFDILKFFPAELAGGVQKLKALTSIFPKVSFMCTGGVNLKNYKKYIGLPNVCSVGGSFVLPKKLIKVNNFTGAIEHLNLL
ncbi:bifunctional 4-hydroxy-2-oxoglutarate aldolase/2-dehydro-3-deoxy-phosphogluconate aldolase [Gammaproteobacteria bacterium]|nr:bifunctional 4-hydroxy-2-oxoglutarate aldolase/2-dehydro-3-deoxy-phosphogluconate aldolase [Gammaproteobacteria bacterium]MDC1131616.1 bifunctional 4-hydroxy-2-oxoglutarate aldolase/2-dehydro-3-deoxy-phosphogluconate aldolase [Gammaproteobacteria bacterium]